jgi:tRNA pseudouridine32 synthase/23S rRNA pseudouridine746 synthase
MVIAHTKKCAAHLSKQFQERQTRKIYQVIVEGALEPGPDSLFTINEPLEGKEAISHVRSIETKNGVSLLEVKIETGRKHQIRQHLAGKGFPVLGDRQYGENRYPELQLTAVELGFTCPISHQFVTFLLPGEYHPKLEKINPRT